MCIVSAVKLYCDTCGEGVSELVVFEPGWRGCYHGQGVGG